MKIAEADHPKCGSDPSSEFGYCPDDNTVYFNRAFAQTRLLQSARTSTRDRATGNVTLLSNQPADFALGVHVRDRLGHGRAAPAVRPFADRQGRARGRGLLHRRLREGHQRAREHAGHDFTLSPADLDEATSAMLDQVGKPNAYGARGTSGLDRIQAFVKGYKGGLSVC